MYHAGALMRGVTPEVSVVLPAYNGRKYVRAAVESILTQTFTDFELIVIDDASSDGSAHILAELARGDSRLQVHRHERNMGFRQALNTGCRIARAPIVAKMSHDDISMPQRLERQVAFLHAHPEVGVVGASVQLIDADDRPGRIQKYPASPGLAAWSMLFLNAIAHPVVTMRRSLLNPAEAYPDGCAGGTEDYALFGALSRHQGVASLDEVLLRYRAWPGSMTSTLSDEQNADATRIAVVVARSWGITLEPGVAVRLRGLPLEQYPIDDTHLRELSALIHDWTDAVLTERRWSSADRSAIRRAAATRLLHVGALVSTRSPFAGLSQCLSALVMSPAALLDFSAKAARALRSKLSSNTARL